MKQGKNKNKGGGGVFMAANISTRDIRRKNSIIYSLEHCGLTATPACVKQLFIFKENFFLI